MNARYPTLPVCCPPPAFIRSGYIGSQSATTDHLKTLINATLAKGRGVVAAIQRVLPDPRYSDFDPTADD